MLKLKLKPEGGVSVQSPSLDASNTLVIFVSS
jgi:hypothetical protein